MAILLLEKKSQCFWFSHRLPGSGDAGRAFGSSAQGGYIKCALSLHLIFLKATTLVVYSCGVAAAGWDSGKLGTRVS